MGMWGTIISLAALCGLFIVMLVFLSIYGL